MEKYCDCDYSPSGLDGVVLTVTRVVAILSAYKQIQCINRMGVRKILYFTLLLALLSAALFFVLISYIFSPIQVNITDIIPFFVLLFDVPKTVCLGQRIFSTPPTSRYAYRIALASGFQKMGPVHCLNFVVSVLLLAMGLILNLKYLKLVCLLSILCVTSMYVCFMTIYPALLVLFSEVCLYGCKSASKHHEFIIDCRDIECSYMSCDSSSLLMKVKAMISLGSFAVHVLIYYLNPTECAYSLCKTATNTLNNIKFYSSNAKHFDSEFARDDSVNGGHSGFDLNLIADRETIDLIYGYDIKTEPLILCIVAIGLTVKFLLSESYSPTIARISESERPLNEDNQVVTDQLRAETNDPSVNNAGLDSPDGGMSIMNNPEDARRSRHNSLALGSNSETNVGSDPPVFDRSVSWSSGGQMDNVRSFAECVEILNNEGLSSLTDLEVVMLIKTRKVQAYNLEQKMEAKRAIAIRRELISQQSANSAVFDLPYIHFDYKELRNSCCENVIGYVQLPVGIVGPLIVNGQSFFVPMATTEGALVASTNRGCKALHSGVQVVVTDSGMTRAPAVVFPSIVQADVFCNWFKAEANIDKLRREVSEDSRHTKLVSVTPTQSGKHVFLRFQATTGDAMGMNMVSKAVEKCLLFLKCEFTSMKIITVSGNMCTDKKPSAINWILGRGKRVIAEATISRQIVQSVLKTDVDNLVELNTVKNLLGSALAGSIGGCNAHAANIITAIFIATGQDPAQVVESSNCLTYIEKTEDGNLSITCTLPCLEVGTIGGGTALPAQKAALKMLHVQGPTNTNSVSSNQSRNPDLSSGSSGIETGSSTNIDDGVTISGDRNGYSTSNCSFSNAKQLAAIIGSCVVAGELSLLSALASGDLVKSHLKLNRANENSKTKVA